MCALPAVAGRYVRFAGLTVDGRPPVDGRVPFRFGTDFAPNGRGPELRGIGISPSSSTTLGSSTNNPMASSSSELETSATGASPSTPHDSGAVQAAADSSVSIKGGCEGQAGAGALGESIPSVRETETLGSNS